MYPAQWIECSPMSREIWVQSHVVSYQRLLHYYPSYFFWLTLIFKKKNQFSLPPPAFFDGQYPMIASFDVNYVDTDMILWREVTETKGFLL